MTAATDWLIEVDDDEPETLLACARRRTAGATGCRSSRRHRSGSTAMLATATGDPDEPLAVLQPRRGIVTRRAVAVNAVLAGCTPDVFAVVLTAVRALCRPEVEPARASTRRPTRSRRS